MVEYIVLSVFFGLLGAGLTWAYGNSKLSEISEEKAELEATLQAVQIENARLEERAQKLDDTIESLKSAQDKVLSLEKEVASLNSTNKEQEKSHAEKIEALTSLKSDIEKELKAITGVALKENQTTFLDLAKSVFAEQQKAAGKEFGNHTEKLEAQLNPVKETLKKYQESLEAIEKSRGEAYGSLSAELKNVAAAQVQVKEEASKLVNALRAAPKTRGRWGEETLRNVMELSQMSEHCDFNTEVTIDGEDGRIRPDVIIRMPGDRHVVVDAKTSTSAYMDALETVDDDEKEAFLVTHAKQVRDHMKLLGSKQYQNSLDQTPDFVAMFIPGENFYAAAMERDPDLFEDAISKGVLIVTPTTLIALAKAIAFGWRQEKVAQNAKEVADLGKVLYQRLSTMGQHIGKVGTGLKRSVENYNKFIGSLETSVMPQARKFNDLKVEGTNSVIEEITPVELDTRELRTDKDFSEKAPAIEDQSS